MYENFKYIGVILEVSVDTGIIVDADLTLITDLARTFFRRIVVGHNLRDGFPALLEAVRNTYFAPSTSALLSALRGAQARFNERQAELKSDET